MNLLNRKGSEEEPVAEVVVEEKAGGKNAPTPKRSAARADRAKKAKGVPKTRAERSARLRELRVETAASLKATDPALLPKNERVPELILVRDLIDSRRNPASFLLPVFIIYFIGSVVPIAIVRLTGLLFAGVWFVIMIADSIWLSRRVQARVRERFPNTPVRMGAYIFRRTYAPRRMRRPVVRPDIPTRNSWAGFEA